MDLRNIKGSIVRTLSSQLIGTYRILLGISFALVGGLKLVPGDIHYAWNIQLSEIGIPLCIMFLWLTPALEILAGGALVAGYFSRLAALVILPIMAVAVYSYLTVSNPEAFLLEPYEGVIPPVMIMLAFIILIYGGGSWSMDLRISKRYKQ